MLHSTLPDGPLDLIGDVHGELDALRQLLGMAGYDEHGRHPDGRFPVFLGDLVDRGPDSPGVVALVRDWVARGAALTLLGNHELNLLRGQHKQGNDWFWGEGATHDSRFAPYALLDASLRGEVLEFFDHLPLALSRPDLRVVHAAWHEASVTTLQSMDAASRVIETFNRLDAEGAAQLDREDWPVQARAEKARWRHHFHDDTMEMPMLDAVGRLDQKRQMLNPIRVLTSGVERVATESFFAGGQWRFVERVAWWKDYADPVPVVMGHYWRQALPIDRSALGKGDADIFEDLGPTDWMGPAGRVFCADFSVGGRYQERRQGRAAERTRLAMLRWPERTLLFDTGERFGTKRFGG